MGGPATTIRWALEKERERLRSELERAGYAPIGSEVVPRRGSLGERWERVTGIEVFGRAPDGEVLKLCAEVDGAALSQVRTRKGRKP